MTNNKSNYIQTEIGLIPEDWKIYPIKDLALIKTGSRNTQDKVEEGDYPFFVRSQTIERINSYSFDGEAVLTAGDGVGVGKVIHYVNEKFDCHQRVYRISDFKDGINGYYFYLYFSNNFLNRIMQMTAKSSVDSVRMEMIADMQVPIPPTLQEQTAIAQALSDTDNLITNLQNLINKKRQLKQAAMHQLLTPKEHWDKEKNSEFKNVKLGDIADIQRGASPRPIEDPIWFDNNSETGWVRISDVTDANKFLVKTTQRLSNLGIKNSRYVCQDSLIMSICATIGKPIITRINVCIHDGFVVFKNLKVNMVYLYYILEFIQNEWSKNGQTGSQMNLNTSLINNFQFVIIKSSQQQNYIAELLSDIDLEIESINNKLDKALKLKDGMMQNLLTGKIRLV